MNLMTFIDIKYRYTCHINSYFILEIKLNMGINYNFPIYEGSMDEQINAIYRTMDDRERLLYYCRSGKSGVPNLVQVFFA